jgi:S-DNA-T family DNA segregation ATPase FtsK/SpoIIIE
VDKKLKAEEKEHQKRLEEYDAMFSQSPTRSLVDKVFKKSQIPTKEELQANHLKKMEAIKKEHELEETFSKFDSKGYAFDEEFEKDTIVEKAPDIFDNHIEPNPSDLDIEITGFGTIVEESIKKAYEESNLNQPETVVVNVAPVKHERVSSFDAAFDRAEKLKSESSIKVKDDFYDGTPMSEEEKANVDKFDQLTGVTQPTNVEESKIPDEVIEKHMNESVRLEFENYNVPPIHLLKKNMTLNTENKQVIYEKAKRLEEILANFKIDAQVIQISRGPAITRYEIELKPGTKMSKITNLSDDIALNLATQQVRIAAVPGKAAVGIEVPNESTSLVTLREVLDSKEFSTAKGSLSVGLGKNIAGQPIVADLSKMPHMLIAGATGSGKSVCVNTLITSILLNAKPDEVKFLMIDPKVVELNNYNGIPHLILPVVTDPKKASVALNWAVQEMTKRYNEFAENSVRDISGFNKKFGADKDRFMPQIVVIIDELADLMMVAPNQVEDAICRLAQMARAAGIHLIVATQRPSVDVITGVIKANIPSRIAFAVSSAIDSRTIIDMSGAEKLLGKGDMLYYPVGSSKPQRVQGAFIGDDEVEEIVDAIKTQFDAFKYDEKILDKVSHAPASTNDDEDEDDEYFSQAVRLVIEMEQASISMLQRKFKIGYNRAARLVDTMEERGIVGPSQGSKPREVLVGPSEIN